MPIKTAHSLSVNAACFAVAFIDSVFPVTVPDSALMILVILAFVSSAQSENEISFPIVPSIVTVSYTHLDVYKRQARD